MSRIKEMREALERVEAKIGFYEGIKKVAKSWKEDPNQKGLKEEIVKEVSAFIDARIMDLENGVLDGNKTRPPSVKPGSEAPTPLHKEAPKSKVDRNKQLIEFVTKYKQFSFKKVSATTTDGEQVTGVVKSVAFPDIQVEQEGFLHSVIPETIKFV